MSLEQRLADTADRPLGLVGVGEAMVELFASEPLGRAKQLRRSYGGDVLNALVSASRLSVATGFVSRVGNDPFGESLREAWRAEGIDVQACPLVDGVNGVYFISVDEAGEREFTYRRAGSAASRLGSEDVDPAYLSSARMVLLSGITQAISPTAETATVAAARVARQHGLVVAYDPNYREALWRERGSGARARARRAAEALLPLTDVALLSVPGEQPVLEHAAEPEAWRSKMPAGAIVCIKRGADGATVVRGEQRIDVAAESVDRVLDTTGAGDAWNAGFLAGLLRGVDLEDAARGAGRVAAAVVGYRGAIPPAAALAAVVDADPWRTHREPRR